jgi:hypothetical protein
MWQGSQVGSYGRGRGVIMNANYTVVKTVEAGNNAPSIDIHEFNLINNGKSALVTIYESIPYDLSDYNVTSGQGWLNQGVFQEIDTDTGEVIFEWKSIDHVDVHDSYIQPNSTDVSGDGLTAATAFDYL